MDKSRKKIIEYFNAMFWANIICLLLDVVVNFLHVVNILKYDVSNLTLVGFIISIIYIIGMYITVKLAKENSILAGILGIAFGTLEIILGGSLFKIIGIILVINSIMYLTLLKKKA